MNVKNLLYEKSLALGSTIWSKWRPSVSMPFLAVILELFLTLI